MRDRDIALSWIHHLEYLARDAEREHEALSAENERVSRMCKERIDMSPEEAFEIFKESQDIVGVKTWESILDVPAAELSREDALRIVQRGSRQWRRAMKYFDTLFPHYLCAETTGKFRNITQEMERLQRLLTRADETYDRCSARTSTSFRALCTCEMCCTKCTDDSSWSPGPSRL